MTAKLPPGATRSKARKRAGTNGAAGDASTRDTTRSKPSKPAPSKPRPKPTPGKRGEVNDAHDRYANIEVD